MTPLPEMNRDAPVLLAQKQEYFSRPLSRASNLLASNRRTTRKGSFQEELCENQLPAMRHDINPSNARNSASIIPTYSKVPWKQCLKSVETLPSLSLRGLLHPRSQASSKIRSAKV